MNEQERAWWRAADEHFDALADLDRSARAKRLEALDLPEPVRERLEALLRAEAVPEGPLDRPPIVPADAGHGGAQPSMTGRVIAGWRLGDELGRGGMGVVYRAERQQPGFTHSAALKLLRIGMLDTSSRERFAREQQILARLQHPGLASLFDGGVTEDGTPFLVMEAIHGAPIDRFAAERGLSSRAIVELVLQVVDTVGFAHRSLVVHRDLKPANILVDEQGRARLLDFGVAKLLDDGPAQATVTRVLTPGFGAPEQATGEVVTTAADVYGIGAVLDHLLSARAQGAAEIGADLANVVAKALRAEPERRYASAEALGDDLRRWLDGRPVAATPDRLGYRLRKLVGRHRVAATAVAVAGASLLIGSALALWQATVARDESVRARQSADEAARQLARAEAVTTFLVDTFAAAAPAATSGAEVSVQKVLDAGAERVEQGLQDEPETRRALRSVLGQISYQLGDLERAERLLSENLLASGGTVPSRLNDLIYAARTASRAGAIKLADERFEQAAAIAAEAPARDRIRLLVFYGSFLVEANRAAEALERVEALSAEGVLAEAPTELAVGVHSLRAGALLQLQRLEEARQAAHRSLELIAKLDERPKLMTAGTHGILANVEASLGNVERALALKQSVLKDQIQVLGDDHPEILLTRNDLATFLKNLGQFEDSAVELEALLRSQRDVLGRGHPNIANTWFNLAQARDLAGDARGAHAAYREAIAQADRAPEVHGVRHGVYPAVFGHSLAGAGRYAEGDEMIDQGLERSAALVGPEHPLLARLFILRAERLNDRGRHDAARTDAARALPILEATYDDHSREVALARIELGRALAMAHAGQARELLQRGIEALEASPFRHQYQSQIAKAHQQLARL